MEKIRTNLACVVDTLWNDMTKYPTLVVIYVMLLILTGIAMGLFWYIQEVLVSGTSQPALPDGSNYVSHLVSQSLTAMFYVSIACLLRRYWQFYGVYLTLFTVQALYISAAATTNNPEPIELMDRVGLFTMLFVTSIKILFVPALTFFGLCCLAGLPRPQSRGWGACIRERMK